MINLTFEQLNCAKFALFDGNPVVRCQGLSPVVADPSVLTPDNSHDGKWHMFCHTLYGVEHYMSADGVKWEKQGKVRSRAMRPDVNFIDGKYYLYYERVQPLIKKAFSLVGGKWFSEIYVTSSHNLIEWTNPIRVIDDCRPYMHDDRGTSISNPYLIKMGNRNRLYFSSGLTYIEDCRFCEPTFISYAESESLTDDFVPRETPLLSPNAESKFLNLCCGCLKVYKLKDCYIGLQNGIYKGEDNKSHSAIMLLRSDDGNEFSYVKTLLSPCVCPGLKADTYWMKQYVYACSLVHYDGRLWLYFNARDKANPVKGREHIGLYRQV